MTGNLERRVRLLEIYAAIATIVIAVFVVAGFATESQKQKFTELDVERLNVVEKDGRPAFVLSNSERVPPPIVDGVAMQRSGGQRAAIVFYNNRGDENGGLIFAGRETANGYAANAGLLFDQYRQGETVGVTYSDSSGQQRAGLFVRDNPPGSIVPVATRLLGMKPGPEQQAAIKQAREAGDLGTDRLFVGKLPDRSTQLLLSDTKGKPRLKIAVDAAGNPSISFLDESGKATYTLPPPADKQPVK